MKTKKRFFSILLSLALVLGLMPGMSLKAYADVTTYECNSNGTGTNGFITLLKNAKDGDIIKLTSNITMQYENRNAASVATGCLVTLDLNGHTISVSNSADYFGVASNSALLIKNGTLVMMDTQSGDAGVVSLF